MCLEHGALLEHRCAARFPLSWPVVLHSPSRGGLAATLVNISAGGACIRLDDEPLNSCRLVELRLPGPAGPVQWPALVIHRNGPFLGLMFDRPRRSELAAILDAPGARGDRPAERAAA